MLVDHKGKENHSGWKRLQEAILTNLLINTESTDLVQIRLLRDLLSIILKNAKNRLHSLSYRPVAVASCPHSEVYFPYVSSNFSFYDHYLIYDHCLTDVSFSITKKNNKTRFKLAISRYATYLSFIHFHHTILGLTSLSLSPYSFCCLSTVCSPLTITNNLLCVYCIEMKTK